MQHCLLPLPETFIAGESIHGDFRELDGRLGSVDRIITSPPFIGMRFDRPNWLRMWFCGWGEDDFHQTSRGFLERQQTQSFDVYREFYAICFRLLKAGGLMIVHIGGSHEHKMVSRLVELGAERMRIVGLVEEDVRGSEHHGLKDKGLTTSHHFIFFQND